VCATVHLAGDLSGGILDEQLQAAATESPDLFVVEGVTTAAEAEAVAAALERNKAATVPHTYVTATGLTKTGEGTDEVGFDIPALLLCESAPGEDVARVVSADERLVGLASLEALGEGDVARLHAALGGAALLAPSQEAGEVAVV